MIFNIINSEEYGAVIDISNLIGANIGSERRYCDLFSE